jgi:hypothetical protein
MLDWNSQKRFSIFSMTITSPLRLLIAYVLKLGLRTKKVSHPFMAQRWWKVIYLTYYQGPYLHSYMLPRWGMPIGELWDLDKLAVKCRTEGRYTFFLSSAPDNVPGMLLSSCTSIMAKCRLIMSEQEAWEAGQMRWRCFEQCKAASIHLQKRTALEGYDARYSCTVPLL